MPSSPACVVISRLPPSDLRRDFVSLPPDYGKPAYFSRPDIQAIQALIRQNLLALDQRIGFLERLRGRKVLLKPNLVTVYSGMGLIERDYPETTDPRLLDALVAFLLQYTREITIIESSGRGVPTRGSFRVAGLDRLARYRGVGLVPLEEQVTVRYLLPQARVQKEIIVPQILGEVLAGEAFFISVPKLKTNLYTGVTLGFKNSMGLLPYNLRQRHHHFALDQKLVDILHLFQPHLTIIDGLVGGEGNCPAPVDPVDSRLVISGNNVVETDRVAARLMGFDPASIPLIALADEAGFGAPQVEIVGDRSVVPFRPADPSFMGPAFRSDFPNVRVLVGHDLTHAPRVGTLPECTPALALAMENACRGGCLATAHFAFDMFLKEGQRRDFSLVLVIGGGFLVNGERYLLDHTGKPHSLDQVRAMPGRKMVVGDCSARFACLADRFVEGCIPFPNSPHAALHILTGTHCTVMGLKNRHLVPLLFDTLRMCEARKRLYRQCHRLDIPLSGEPVPPELSLIASAGPDQPIIPWPLPPLTPREVHQACSRENRAVLATFLG